MDLKNWFSNDYPWQALLVLGGCSIWMTWAMVTAAMGDVGYDASRR